MAVETRIGLIGASVLAAMAFAAAPVAASDCPNRGDLDDLFCDADGDLVALHSCDVVERVLNGLHAVPTAHSG